MTSALGVIVSFFILASAMTMPSSLVLIEARKGRLRTWVLMTAFGGLCWLVGGPDFTAWMLVGFVVPGLGLAIGCRKSSRANWVYLTGYLTAAVCLAAYYAVVVFGANITTADLLAFARSATLGFKEIFVNYGLSQEDLSRLPGGAEKFISYVLLLSPSLMLASLALVVWINLLIIVRFGVEGRPYRGSADLSAWSAPEMLVFGVLVPGLILTVVREKWAAALSANVLILFMMPFFFQGMAVTSHTLRKLRLSPGMRFLSYALIFGLFGGMVVPAQASIGVLDIWMDFRRLRVPPTTEAEETEEEKGDRE